MKIDRPVRALMCSLCGDDPHVSLPCNVLGLPKGWKDCL